MFKWVKCSGMGVKKCPVKEEANAPSSRKMSPIMMKLRCYSPTGMLLVYIGVYPSLGHNIMEKIHILYGVLF